jgi:hypothetical protein
MKKTLFLSFVLTLTLRYVSFSQPPASQDTIFIPGDSWNTLPYVNAGALNSTINADTLPNGSRINPNRVYALYEGRTYYQTHPLAVNNSTGTLTIIGVPSQYGTEKSIIVVMPLTASPVPSNVVYGSIKLVNIQYQAMDMDKTLQNELYYCGTKNSLPQSLTIDNCLFEFCNIDLFDCSNESGAIGG